MRNARTKIWTQVGRNLLLFLFVFQAIFRAFVKQVIGPLLLADLQWSAWFPLGTFCSGSWSALRRNLPVLRRIRNSPNIAMSVKRSSNEAVLAVIPERKTIGNTRGHAASAGQPVQHDGSFQLQRARAAESAALRADNEYSALLRKRAHPVQTHHADRYVHADARAAARRFGCENFHLVGTYPTLPLHSDRDDVGRVVTLVTAGVATAHKKDSELSRRSVPSNC
jgi:hypothetical protein